VVYGYHRTSTAEQHLDRGIKEIADYCSTNNIPLERIYTDQQTGKNFDRPRYRVLKEDILRPGDTLIVSELDRLGRNKQSTLQELKYFKDHNIRVMILEIPTTLQDLSKIDNSLAQMIMDTINNMLIELYATMAQAEIEKKEKRQREGLDAKRARGEWDDVGRPKAMEFKTFCKQYQLVVDGKKRPFELIKELGMTKPTFYRYKKRYENSFND
jgi:DNA invertase Pin-like site-specific DNA recombinase